MGCLASIHFHISRNIKVFSSYKVFNFPDFLSTSPKKRTFLEANFLFITEEMQQVAQVMCGHFLFLFPGLGLVWFCFLFLK